MKIAAIIPARGGSKGIPGKNIVRVAGLPLIAWSIKQAKGSALINEVYVSTEDEKIAKVSRRYGAVAIKRPADLATDISSSEDALIHALSFIRNNGYPYPDIIVFLQATSPIRGRDDIDNAVKKFLKEKADSLFSCVRLEDYFIWENKGGKFRSINYDYRNRIPRQLIKPQYLENGSIYIFRPGLLEKNHNRLGGKITVYEMPFWKSYQIDDRDDLEICEYYLKRKILKKEV